jgi:acyl carrier protein
MKEIELGAAIAQAIRAVSPAAGSAADVPETLLLKDLGLDSLDLVAVILRVQERFEIEIDLDEVPQLESVKDLSDCVSRHLALAA